MEGINSEAQHPRARLIEAQMEKLQLEIKHLKDKRGWERKLASYSPLLSVTIAVGGFLFGIYQFQRQQKAQQGQLIVEQQNQRFSKDIEQAIRIQNQIRSDLDQILQFPKDKQETISKVSFLLEDLKEYVNLSSEQSQASSSRNKERAVSIVLAKSVVNDCDFEQARDVVYANSLATQWEDYGLYLKDVNPQNLKFILNKYIDALGSLYHREPRVVMGVRFTENGEFSYTNGFGKLDVYQVTQFQDVVDGFTRYMWFLHDETVREIYLLRFQAAMCNPTLMKQLFQFTAKNDPEKTLGKCSK